MPKKKKKIVRDRHLLYTAAVQSVDADLDFFARVYKRKRGERFRTLREDFCGTAALACDWVSRKPDHRAWGVDLDAATLAWGRREYVSRLGPAAKRVELIERDVLAQARPKADVIAALRFDLRARDRGLERIEGRKPYYFPSDYPRRLTDVVREQVASAN